MFSMNFLGRRGKVVAVADIGSGSASVAIVSLQRGKPAEVLFAERAILPIEERSKEATIAAVGNTLVQAGEKVLKAVAGKAGKQPVVEELHCMIGAPWCRSVTVQAHSTSATDLLTTQIQIDALAKQALAGQTTLDQNNILEASVVRVELNGYPTGAPVGKQAKELKVFALVSDCDPALRAGVTASLQKIFPHLTPAFRSSTRTILSVLQEWRDSEKDHLIVDIVSEGTMLIAVREGTIVGQHLIPEGTRSILKRLSPSGMAEETLGLIRMYERNQSSDDTSETIQTSIAKVEPELVRVFGEGMAASASLRKLPTRLILIAHADMAPWLARFFSRIDFTQFTATTQPFSVDTLTPKDLSRWVTSAHGVVLDTGTALSVALIAREQKAR